MSIGSLSSVMGSVAGAPLAQTKGSEPERAEQTVVAQQTRADSDRKAEAAAGIGETDGEDHEPAERDADGRRPWEAPPGTPPDALDGAAASPPPCKDATGQTGRLLDLTG